MTTPRRKTASADVAIDFVIDSDLWKKHPGAEDTVRQAIAEAARATRALPGDVAIVLTDDAAMQALNKRWRGHDKPTNVLSFPAHAMPGDGEPAHLGDIVIAFEITAGEAERDAKSFAHHLAHLAVHGYLHLLGHDHESDRDADAMERLETDILARIGVPDPYAEAATLKNHA
jgi:probable rRNA maturation factor